MDLDKTLETFFRNHAPLARGETILAAFSGGADSTALLDSLIEYGRLRGIRVAAAHIDHRLDPESRARATAAESAAAVLGLDLIVDRQDVLAQKRSAESLEVAARRIRYRELTRIAREVGAIYIATGHHRDDQAETVLLRLAGGHGPSSLAAVPRRRGSIVRPLLDHGRRELLQYVQSRGLPWVDDPTNRDLATPRNRLRHLVIPHLTEETPDISRRLANLAEAAKGANARLRQAFDQQLAPVEQDASLTVSRRALESLPSDILPEAIVHLLRGCGRLRRPSRQALGYAQKLIASRAPMGVDLGDGWRLEEAGNGRLRVLQTPEPTPLFAYNLHVPGEVRLAELASSFRLSAGCVEPWMFQGARRRVGFSLSLGTREQLTVRNRRPGDRVQPLGSSSRHKLKDILINHGIPKLDRDRIPLLCHSDRILWVPGVTVDHEARIRDERNVWIAEIIPDE